jgi:hypothetical protein
MRLVFPGPFAKIRAVEAMARSRDYPIIRFLIGSLYTLAIFFLLAGLASGGYLWVSAEAQRLPNSKPLSGPFGNTLYQAQPDRLCLGAAVLAGGGLVAFLVFGAFGQILAIQRDRAINAALQVQLLEDILEINEEYATASRESKVEICEGCGRLGSLHRIDSGQWVCRVCRVQLRSA